LAAALDAPDDERDPEKDLEDDTNGHAGDSGVPKGALGVAVCVGHSVIVEVVGSVALVVGVLTSPGAKEATADDEEHDRKAEAEDRPSLSEPLLLDEILLVGHCGGDVWVDAESVVGGVRRCDVCCGTRRRASDE